MLHGMVVISFLVDSSLVPQTANYISCKMVNKDAIEKVAIEEGLKLNFTGDNRLTCRDANEVYDLLHFENSKKH